MMPDEREANMSYLKDFRERLSNGDYTNLLKLWEEYCYGDQPDGEELVLILQEIKNSEFSKTFGTQVERVIPIWREIKNAQASHDCLRLVFDLETTNSEDLAQLAISYLQERYAEDPLFLEKMRLVGLRNREHFQGCIRNFELLTHMKKGNFVFHTAGWGTGEILEVSFVREELTLEFEYVIGYQHLSFEKAFKTLMPLTPEHFYARRFGNPDQLEHDAKESPNEVIRMLLGDLGPKTAAEIKEELNELVIPEEEWNRWWQAARARIKKDTKIESPTDLKGTFRLRTKELPHEVGLHKALEGAPNTNATIQMVYTFMRDFPETLKSPEFRASLEGKLKSLLSLEELTESQRLQILFFQEDLHIADAQKSMREIIEQMAHPDEVIRDIEVLAFQKRVLQLVRKCRKEWKELFLGLFSVVEANLLRDFILHELNTPEMQQSLIDQFNALLINPMNQPDFFVWLFQKIIDKKGQIVGINKSWQNRFFEGLLVLLGHLDQKPQYRELSKKVVALLTANRYKIVRDIMQQSSIEEVREYLLLATKCRLLTDHDIKIMHSLAEVVYPTLAQLRREKGNIVHEEQIVWTSQAGYQKMQERIQEIATKETVHNAREIEAARSLGDLRENAEFKAALERRDRLQSELKMLSDQMAAARIITPADVSSDEVGIGSVVYCRDPKGATHRFTLLGPWDADPEQNILSFQSKLAQAMKGKSVDEKFTFQGEQFVITDVQSFFDQER